MLLIYVFALFFCACTACDTSLVGESVKWGEGYQNDKVTRDGLGSLKGVPSIEICHVRIKTLCADTFKDLDELKRLLMQFNSLEEIQPKAFSNVDSLEDLSIIHNKVMKIEVGVFNGMKIKHLDLSSNKINEIHPHAFDDMPNLGIVHLIDNNIRHIDNRWFHNTPNIFGLVMRDNDIQEIPSEAFVNLRGNHTTETGEMFLQIDLTGNPIETVHPQAFENLQVIGGLFLEDNKIKSLDKAVFSSFTYIDTLNLKNNLLESLPSDIFASIQYQHVLILEDNAIECLPENLDNILKAKYVFLGGNRWKCDCVKRVQDWSKGKEVILDWGNDSYNCNNVAHN